MLNGFPGLQFPSTRMEDFLPIVSDGATDEPRPWDFPKHNSGGARWAKDSSSQKGKSSYSRHSTQNQATKSYLCPFTRKVSNQCAPVQKRTAGPHAPGSATSQRCLNRADQTRQTPEPWFILSLTLFFLISSRETSFVFAVFIPAPTILFLFVWCFSKMVAPSLRCVSRWLGTAGGLGVLPAGRGEAYVDTQGLMVVQKARGVFKEFFPETSTKTELPEFFFATRQKTFPGTIYGGLDPRPTCFMVNTGWHCWTSSLPASWPQRDGTSGGRRAPPGDRNGGAEDHRAMVAECMPLPRARGPGGSSPAALH